MAASASNTGTPSAAKSLAVSLLPMPIPPVRPITKGLLALTQNLFQCRAQGGCDFRLLAEKSMERWHRLMHQHVQAIDGLVAARGGVFQKLRFQRVVNNVTHGGVFAQGREIEIERRI